MKMQGTLHKAALRVALAALIAPAFGSAAGIIQSITKAPVVPGGNVAGPAPELIINLDVSMDPTVPGRSLMQGKKITFFLPEGFIDTGSVPVLTLFNPGCVPGSLETTLLCNTVGALQGFPQHPVGFPPPLIPSIYQVTAGGPNILVLEALQDIVPAPPLEPGIKQFHLFLVGYTLPRPGEYEIQMVSETGPGGAEETGSGFFQILPQPKPSINVAGAFNPGSPNTIYQQTSPGELTPLPYDFLLWDQSGMPMLGVEISNGLLVQGQRKVGHVSIEAPVGAVGQDVFSTGPSTPILAPITGVPTARLTARFQTGSLPGEYAVRFHLAGGNLVEMFVDVE